MRENCTYSLSGGRWLARKRATSDPTPMKPSNKVTGQSPEAAEDPEGTPEGRARTKENVQQARAVPAQDGAAASQGLKRVQKAARERKQEQFTTLLHHLTVDLLRDRCHALKREAAPGVDAREMGGMRRRTGATAERSARTGAPGQLIGGEIEDIGVGADDEVAEAEHFAVGGEEDGAVGGFAGHQFGLDQGQGAGGGGGFQPDRPHG